MPDRVDRAEERAPGGGSLPGSDRRAPDFIAIGRIARAHGVLGEVQVEVYTDFPEERFAPGAQVWIGADDGDDPQATTVESVRPHRDRLLVTLAGVADRESAERLRGLYVLAPGATAHALPDDEFYAHELVGLAVFTLDGAKVGEVVGILETGGTDVLRVVGDGPERLVPMSRAIVVSIDVPGGRIVIDPPAGLV